MREVRVFSEQSLTADSEVELDSSAARHLSQVLRMKAGEALTVFDGRGGEYPAVIARSTRSTVTVAVGQHRDVDRESPLVTTLWHGLCRGERMDTVVQKATELGVTRICPLLSERSVIRLDAARRAKKAAHWRRIAISACEQSGRNTLPDIAVPGEMLDLLDSAPQHEQRLLLHPGADLALPAALQGQGSLLLCVGPEGGFSPAEVTAAQNAGLTPVSLGPRVLRTETAPLAALAVVQALAGDLR